MNPFDLQRDAFGRWTLTLPDGTVPRPGAEPYNPGDG